MTREEFIGKLQMVYVGDRNAFNDIVGVYDELENINDKLSNALTSAESKIDKAIDMLDNYQNNLYSKSARETLDDDIERALKTLKGSDTN